MLTFSYDTTSDFEKALADDFNNYAKNNNLDIQINHVGLSVMNVSILANGYGPFVKSMLKRKSKNYDLIFMDNTYTTQFVNYVTDLKNYVSKETIDKYTSKIALAVEYVGDKLMALVLSFFFFKYK